MGTRFFKVVQNAIIQNVKREVLLLKHHKGKWVLPGGEIEDQETWQRALRREIEEEVGILNFQIKEIVFVSNRQKDGKSVYVVTFKVEAPIINKITLSKEHTQYAWVGLSEIDNYEFWYEDVPESIKSSLKTS